MPQATAYDAAGVPIPDDQVAAAVQAGQANYTAGSDVFMKDPATGEDVRLPAENAAKAIADGYTVLDPAYVREQEQAASRRAEYGGGLATVQATAEGAARGLTFGLSDQALAQFQGGGSGLAARQELNPNAALGGELVGAVAPMFFTGGASGGLSATARGARALGAMPLGVSRAAGALERGVLGALGGGGRTTAGRIGANVLAKGSGAALEGAAYGAGQTISQAALTDTDLTAEKLLSGAGEGALMGGLVGGGLGGLGSAVGMGAERLLAGRSIRGKLSETAELAAFRQATGGNVRAYNEAIRKGGIDKVRAIGRSLLEDGVPITGKGWTDDAVSAIQGKLKDAGTKMEAVAAHLDEVGAKIDHAGIMAKVDDQVAKLRSSTSGAKVALGDVVEGEFAPFRKKLTGIADQTEAPMSFSDMWRARQELDDAIYPLTKEPTQGPKLKALEKLRGTYDDAIEEAVATNPELAKAWKESKSVYSDYSTVSKGLGSRVKKDASQAAMSGSDRLMGLGGSGLGLVAGMATGSFGLGALTSLGVGALTSAGNKFIREQGAGLLAKAADRLSKTETRMSVAAQRLSGASKLPPMRRLVVPVGAALQKRFDETRQDLDQLKHPERLQARLQHATGGIEQTEPQLAAAIQDRVVGDVQYLQQQMPQGLTRAGSSLTPDAEKARYSKADMSRFVRQVAALDDPVSVMEQVADGHVDRDAIEALKVRRPRIYQSIRERVMMYTANSQETLPYSKRISLSLAFDFQGDASMQPANMQAIQASFIPAGQGPEKAGPAGKLDAEDQVEDMALPGDTTAQT